MRATPAFTQLIFRLSAFYRCYGWILLLAGLLLLSGYAVERFLWGTAVYGIGVRTDSVEYLWTAKNIAAGLGLSRLTGSGELKAVTHWPPFYPLVLSLFESAGVPALTGARWLGALLTGLIVLLSGLTVARVTRSVGLALLVALLLTQSPSLWITSLDAMTEPLYVVLGLGGALLLELWLARRRKWAFGLSALCLGAALLTRYVGLTLVVTASLVLLFYRRPFTRRPADWLNAFKQAVLFGVIALLPMLVWMIYNQARAGSATNRYLNIVPIPASDFQLLNETLTGWFAPFLSVGQIGTGKALLIGGVLLAAFAIEIMRERGLLSGIRGELGPRMQPAIRRESAYGVETSPLLDTSHQGEPPALFEPKAQASSATVTPAPETASSLREASAAARFSLMSQYGDSTPALALFYAIYAVLYPLMVYLSRLLFDGLITIFEERIAFPWFVTLLLLFFFAVGWALVRLPVQRGWARALRTWLVVMVLVTVYTFAAVYHLQQVRVLAHSRESGRGLNSPGWLNAGITQSARKLADNITIYSDNLEVLYFISGRSSFQINELDDAALGRMYSANDGRALVFVFFYNDTYLAQTRAYFKDIQTLYSGGDGNILLVQP